MRYDCRYGMPHDLTILGETAAVKVEKCQICRRTFRWHKGPKGRVDNKRYLEAHARNFAQRGGRTHQLFMKLYHPEETRIVISTP